MSLSQDVLKKGLDRCIELAKKRGSYVKAKNGAGGSVHVPGKGGDTLNCHQERAEEYKHWKIEHIPEEMARERMCKDCIRTVLDPEDLEEDEMERRQKYARSPKDFVEGLDLESGSQAAGTKRREKTKEKILEALGSSGKDRVTVGEISDMAGVDESSVRDQIPKLRLGGALTKVGVESGSEVFEVEENE